DKATWVARASGANHQLQAYVIEMQLRDANGATFLPNTSNGVDRVTGSVNPPANYTVETTEVGIFESTGLDYTLVGGGAYIIANNDITVPSDAYLVESR